VPKFLYIVVLGCGVFWAALLLIIIFVDATQPISTWKVILFITTLFCALTLLGSLAYYKHFAPQKSKFTTLAEEKAFYRKGLKLSAYLTFGIVALMALSAAGLFNVTVVTIFATGYFLVYLNLKSRI